MATDYGRDTSCLTGLRSGRLVKGARLVGEALYRRLGTRRGTLRGGKDEAAYGLPLREEIGKSDVASVASLPGRIEQECRKDGRILEVRATVQRAKVGASVELTVTVSATLKTGVTFSLVLAVSDVTVALVGLSTGDGS